MYGHPDGPKKRFRSPNDFLWHLRWLGDENGYMTDKRLKARHDSCCCKLCVPEDLIKILDTFVDTYPEKYPDHYSTEVPQADVSTGPRQVMPKPEKVPEDRKAIKSIPNESISKMVVPKRPASVSQVGIQQDVPKSMASIGGSQATIAPTPSMSSLVTSSQRPTPLAPPRNFEQGIDAQYNTFLLRPGEVVWWRRGGDMHGLSLIIERHLFVHPRRLEYTIQPLSHPLATPYPPMIRIPSESLLRPWLGWSAPLASHEGLKSCRYPYNAFRWQDVIQKAYGEGDPEIDGSVFAAKIVDASYTLLEPLKLSNSSELSYNGMFLGCEKIWTGEAIRLHVGSGRDIMILHQIIEKRPNGKPGDVSIVGDIYTFETVSTTVPPPKNHFLPARVQADLDYRNRSTITHKFRASYWTLLQSGARLSLADVKGRWYESRVLLPIVQDQAEFITSVGQGKIADVGDMLNMRGLSNGEDAKVCLRKETRILALDRSVPNGTIIGGTTTENTQPSAFQIDPALQAAQTNGMDSTLPVATHNSQPAARQIDPALIAAQINVMDPTLPAANTSSMFESMDDDDALGMGLFGTATSPR